MTETIDREAAHAAKLYAYAERRIELWAMERRRQERQFEQFRAETTRIRITNRDDGVSAAVFHGERRETVRERMLREHREEAEAEQRASERRHVLAVRRKTGVRSYCRHCGKIAHDVRADGPKCASCKADPALITARGSEKRMYRDRPEAQPTIQPLTRQSARVDNVICELSASARDVIEMRYVRRLSEAAAADELGMRVAVFAGLARNAVQMIALGLARADSRA